MSGHQQCAIYLLVTHILWLVCLLIANRFIFTEFNVLLCESSVPTLLLHKFAFVRFTLSWTNWFFRFGGPAILLEMFCKKNLRILLTEHSRCCWGFKPNRYANWDVCKNPSSLRERWMNKWYHILANNMSDTYSANLRKLDLELAYRKVVWLLSSVKQLNPDVL